MKNSLKVIIGLIIVCLAVLLFLGGYAFVKFKSSDVLNPTINKPTKVEKEKKEEERKFKEATKNKGKVVKVQLNETLEKNFYILSEDDNTYTLIAQESVGKSSFYTSDECNETNENNCLYNTEQINEILIANTKDWTNVGQIRLPLLEEIVKVGEFKLEDVYKTNTADYLLITDYWIENLNKESTLGYYMSVKDKAILKDKLYNTHEIVPVINIVKSFVKN